MSSIYNELVNSSSPYLQQHKENPVQWREWKPEVLNEALELDKPILLSVGYSSCHWCHVMAHESFEDQTVADIMNAHFINIKVDREERPDIDQVYMEAVQSMGINGGWPLHVFLTPDQKPFYGGTYFPKEGWKKLLVAVTDAFKTNREKLVESAIKFTDNLNHSQLSQLSQLPQRSITSDTFQKGYDKLANRLDHTWGAFQGAPKFPMPGLWTLFPFLSTITGNAGPKAHFILTADKIASGGIYDQLGGGFSRYSVDPEWHVPHFEKMLYDNGQLLSMYAQAYHLTEDAKYLDLLNHTMLWLDQEMISESGGYYSALDADSEGVEGKYYVWNQSEIDKIAGDNSALICDYFDVSLNGNWENTNVLRKLNTQEEICSKYKITEDQLHTIIEDFRKHALKSRSKRIAPGLDDKIITGWNGLLLSGLCHTHNVLPSGELKNKTKKRAQQLYQYITHHLIIDGKLKHLADSDLEGFSDDYAHVMQSLVDYYESFFEEQAIQISKQLADRLLLHFYDQSEGFFFYVNKASNQLIASKKEAYDNVIPSSNAVIAASFFKLGKLFYDDQLEEIAKNMTLAMVPLIEESLQDAYAWAKAALYLGQTIPEVVIIGPDAYSYADQLRSNLPGVHLIAAHKKTGQFPIFEHKNSPSDQTTIFVCFDRVCQKPTTDLEEALLQLKSIH